MKSPNDFLAHIPPSIFAVMSTLANEHGAINLGQGFPDTDGPQWIRDVAAQALIDGPNQYAPDRGVPALRQAVAEHNKRFYGLDIDPDREVVVTSGASEALLDCFMGLLNPGDEVIVLEPFFDIYVPQIKAAGGIAKFVRLEAPDWTLDEATLRAAFSGKTKLLVLNSPMNPAGKVFKQEELDIIARLLIEFDAYALCDEVYEHLTFDDHSHIPLMTLPGMRERCARIGSAGKTFSLTGWKIGYITAAPGMLNTIANAHQIVTFASPPALQIAVAQGLQADTSYFEGLAKGMNEGRRLLTDGLKKIGFDVLPCEGTYFLTADFAPLGFNGDDVEFCTWLTKEAKVTAIPMSAFYAEENGAPPRSLTRFCFAKKTEILEEALERLNSFFSKNRITAHA